MYLLFALLSSLRLKYLSLTVTVSRPTPPALMHVFVPAVTCIQETFSLDRCWHLEGNEPNRNSVPVPTDKNGVTHDYTDIGSSLHFCFCWLVIDVFSDENMTLSTAILCPPVCISVVINTTLSTAICAIQSLSVSSLKHDFKYCHFVPASLCQCRHKDDLIYCHFVPSSL